MAYITEYLISRGLKPSVRQSLPFFSILSIFVNKMWRDNHAGSPNDRHTQRNNHGDHLHFENKGTFEANGRKGGGSPAEKGAGWLRMAGVLKGWESG